jgi:hypothetical protein
LCDYVSNLAVEVLMRAAQMAAEGAIGLSIICLISGNQREYLRKSAGKNNGNLPQIYADECSADGRRRNNRLVNNLSYQRQSAGVSAKICGKKQWKSPADLSR